MSPDFFLLLFKVPKKIFVFVEICICKKLPFLTLNFTIKKKVDLIFKFPFTKVFKIDGKRCVQSYKTLPKKLHHEEIFEVRKTWFWENSDLFQRYKNAHRVRRSARRQLGFPLLSGASSMVKRWSGDTSCQW